MKTCKDCIHYDVCPHEILPIDIHPSYIDFSDRDDVGEVIKELDTPQSVRMCLDLFDLGNYYYKVANRIGEQWLEVE